MQKARKRAIASAKGLRQKRKWLVWGTGKSQSYESKETIIAQSWKPGPSSGTLCTPAWNLKFIASIKGSGGYWAGSDKIWFIFKRFSDWCVEDDFYRSQSERDRPMRTVLQPGLGGTSVTFVSFGNPLTVLCLNHPISRVWLQSALHSSQTLLAPESENKGAHGFAHPCMISSNHSSCLSWS